MLGSIPDIFSQVINFILHGLVNTSYFPPEVGKDRSPWVQRAFSKTTLDADFLSRGVEFASRTNGIMEYSFPNVARLFTDGQLASIFAPFLQEDETLEDFL